MAGVALLSSGAGAQTFIEIDNGDGNLVTISQVGSETNEAAASQTGANNIANFSQNGEGLVARAHQVGTGNRVFSAQQGGVFGTTQSVLAWQRGDLNVISARQSGRTSLADVAQLGLENSAAVDQSGNRHAAVVSQAGKGHLVTVGQRGGSGNRVDISQGRPPREVTTYEIPGHNENERAQLAVAQAAPPGLEEHTTVYDSVYNRANVQQTGSNHRAMVWQKGSHQTGRVFQLQQGNFGEVIQHATATGSEASILQNSAFNRAVVQQFGSGQTVILTQGGQGSHIADVMQTAAATGATLIYEQTGHRNQLYVTQSTPNAYLQATQTGVGNVLTIGR